MIGELEGLEEAIAESIEASFRESERRFWQGLKRGVRKVAYYSLLAGAFYIAGMGARGIVRRFDEQERAIQALSQSRDSLLVDNERYRVLLAKDRDRFSEDRVASAYAGLLQENERLKEQQAMLLAGKGAPIIPPEAIDTLDLPLGETVLEVDKSAQEARIWVRSNYALLRSVPCSTGKNAGEKERAGDKRTPSGYFTITEVQPSGEWTYQGRAFAYGDYFARFNFGSWDAQGNYAPGGHCSIGAHGTDKESLLGREDSEGCVRLPNEFWRQAIESTIIKPGTKGFIVPYADEELRSSVAGVGYDRLQKVSGKNAGIVMNTSSLKR